MIEAKGGRALLQSVRTVLIEEKTGSFPLRKSVKDDCLYVFPDKVWEWQDRRDFGRGPFSSILTIWNGSLAQDWLIHSYWEDRARAHLISSKRLPEHMENFELAVLLETAYVKPRPVRYRVIHQGFRKRGVLEAEWNRAPIQYVVNLKTMLPERVEIGAVPGQRDPHGYEFSHYVSVDGISVPTRVRHGGTLRATVNWTTILNVKYREDVFEQPPSADYTGDTWRAPSATSGTPLRTDR